MQRTGYIYIMTNKHKTVLYTGVTSDLAKRIHQHRHHAFPDSFTSRYNAEHLIYYESFDRIEEAIAREKQIKKWSRKKKELLIRQKNPTLKDLYDDILNNW